MMTMTAKHIAVWLVCFFMSQETVLTWCMQWRNYHHACLALPCALCRGWENWLAISEPMETWAQNFPFQSLDQVSGRKVVKSFGMLKPSQTQIGQHIKHTARVQTALITLPVAILHMLQAEPKEMSHWVQQSQSCTAWFQVAQMRFSWSVAWSSLQVIKLNNGNGLTIQQHVSWLSARELERWDISQEKYCGCKPLSLRNRSMWVKL